MCRASLSALKSLRFLGLGAGASDASSSFLHRLQCIQHRPGICLASFHHLNDVGERFILVDKLCFPVMVAQVDDCPAQGVDTV